jgi:hypothetical protein
VYNGPNSQFVISEVAHFTLNYYKPPHEEILKTIPTSLQLPYHKSNERHEGSPYTEGARNLLQD